MTPAHHTGKATMTRHETFTFDNLKDFINALGDAHPQARGPITISANLANVISATLNRMSANLAFDIRQLGEAIAAGDCPDCRADFFERHFGNAARTVGMMHESGAAIAKTRTDFDDMIKLANKLAKPAGGAGATTLAAGDTEGAVKLYAEHDTLARDLFKLNPENDRDGPAHVRIHKRADAINGMLSNAGFQTPTTRATIDRRMQQRRDHLRNDYANVKASVADIQAVSSSRALNTEEVADLTRLQQREIDIYTDVTALGGVMMQPASPARKAS
jgi:hypothetical protein